MSYLEGIVMSRDERAIPHASERDRLSEAVERIARGIAPRLELADLSRFVAAEIEAALDAEAAAVIVLDGDFLRFAGATGPVSAALLDLRLPHGMGICGEVVKTGSSALVIDGPHDPRLAQAVPAQHGFATKTLIAAPLIVRGQTIGVVEAVNRARSSLPFEISDLAFLERLAPFVAAAISNALHASELQASRDRLARHNEELEQRVEERTRLVVNAKREWEATFDSIADPIAILEGDIVRRTNRAFAEVTNRDVRAIPGMPCYRARFGRDTPCPGCPIRDAVPETRHVEAEIDIGEQTILVRAYRMDATERPNSWVVSYHDETEKKQLSVRLREAEHLSAIGRLAAGAAHEINNPMAFLVSALQALREHVDPLLMLSDLGASAARQHAEGQVEPLGRTLERLREEADRSELEFRRTDIVQILKEANEGARRVTSIVAALKVIGSEELGTEEAFEGAASLERAVGRATKSAPFSAELVWTRREPGKLIGRPLEIDQALYEIARNAGQACPEGGRIELAAFAEGERMVLEIRDNGSGIAAEHRPRVFEPFFTTRGVGGGVGLGLTMAYGAIRRHGGEIELEPVGGGGTLVRVLLPRALGEESGTISGVTS